MKNSIKGLITAILIGVNANAGSLESKLNTPKYDTLLHEINNKRIELAASYKNANNKNKEKILKTSEDYLNEKFAELVKYWYGTPWAFCGDSNYPGERGIACGYFVTTLLRDLDLNLDRIKLGDQPARNIIKNLVEKKDIKMIKKTGELKKFKDGLYIIGLDNHTGFIYKKGDRSYFCNSNFIDKEGPVCEDAFNSQLINNSKCKMLGKLFEKSLLEKWYSKNKIKLEYKVNAEPICKH